MIAFLGLLLVACWRPDDHWLPVVFIVFALVVMDRHGPVVGAAVLFATMLYHWEPAATVLGIFAYTLFFYSLTGLRWKRAARLGFGFGAGLAALNMRWLVAEFDTRWAGIVLFIVSIYGGIFMAMVAALLRCSLVRRPGSLGLILTALLLPAADYVRTITPRFGIGNLHSAHLPVANLDIAQAAHWVGAGGLSALMAFCSYAAADWLFHERPTQWQPRIAARQAARIRLGVALGLVAFTIGIGQFERFYSGRTQNFDPLKIAIVQSGSPSEAKNYSASLKSYLSSGHRGDILFLPEGAISIGEWNDPADPNVEPLMSLSELEGKFGPEIHSFLITGAMIKEGLGKKLTFRNTAISLDASFHLLGQMDKEFGAPLVEINPFQGIPILEGIGDQATHLSRRMNPQWNRAVLPAGPGIHAVVAICNEHQQPDIWRQRGVKDLTPINLQLVLSDVSWFDNSDEERTQSRLARRLLAAKNRRPLLYVANNGSEFWDSNGTLVYSLEPQTQFAVWNLSIPRVTGENNWTWQAPPEFWPLVLFCALFSFRFFRQRWSRSRR